MEWVVCMTLEQILQKLNLGHLTKLHDNATVNSIDLNQEYPKMSLIDAIIFASTGDINGIAYWQRVITALNNGTYSEDTL